MLHLLSVVFAVMIPTASSTWDLYARLPQFVRDPLVRRRHGSIWSEIDEHPRVVFVHIPKTGGTTLAELLYAKSVNHYPLWVWRACEPKKLSGAQYFTVLRDPVQRLISGIRHVLVGQRASSQDIEMGKFLTSHYGSTSEIFDAYISEPRLRSMLASYIHFRSYKFWLNPFSDALDANLMIFALAADVRPLPSWSNVTPKGDNWLGPSKEQLISAQKILEEDYAYYRNASNIVIRDSTEALNYLSTFRRGCQPAGTQS